MTGQPHHEIKEHVEYQGRTWVVFDRAPHGDSWRLTLHPADLTGAEVHVSDDDVHTIGIPPSARPLLTLAGLNPDHFDEEQAAIEADEEIARLQSMKALALHNATSAALEALGLWHHGYRTDDELRTTYIAYAEAK